MTRAPWLLLLLLASASAAADDGFVAVQRGRALTQQGDCIGCHTVPGGKPFAGGRPIETPFGAVLSANITPDQATGIGAWSDDQFIAALTRGMGPGGTHLYPAMPYPYYTRASQQDLRDIRAYLNSVDPVHNEVHSNQLPFPFNIRLGMWAWNELFYDGGPYKPDPAKSSEWNRGAYLVQGLGHCGACHTPKNFLGGDDTGKSYQGGNLQDWFAPSLTGDTRTGLGTWSLDDVAEYLSTGHNRFAAASGPMAEVVNNSTSRMTDADRHAIALYLKDLPGQAAGPAPIAQTSAGDALYVDNCAACHGFGGEGQPHLFPSLAKAPSVQQTDATSPIRVVLAGQRSVATPGQPTAPAMPSFGWKLNDGQVAAVLTYIRNSWGNAAPAVAVGDVTHLREQLANNPAQEAGE